MFKCVILLALLLVRLIDSNIALRHSNIFVSLGILKNQRCWHWKLKLRFHLQILTFSWETVLWELLKSPAWGRPSPPGRAGLRSLHTCKPRLEKHSLSMRWVELGWPLGSSTTKVNSLGSLQPYSMLLSGGFLVQGEKKASNAMFRDLH